MSYSQVFGGNTIFPSDVSYLALPLTADVQLEWPLDSSGVLLPVARIIDVTPTAGGYSIIMPDATLTSPGQTVLFNNLSGSYTFTVKSSTGVSLVTPATGTQWQLYLASVATASGTWRSYQMGASTATVNPSALAGAGLTVISNQLAQSMPVTTFNSSPRTLLTSDRASVMVWTGSGAGTLNLLTAASATTNYFFSVRNAGGGNLTIDPSGAETIDGAATLSLVPGDSATIVTNGTTWYTVGLGQQAVFAFDYTAISLTGAGTTYTLTGSELNRITYEFTGVLSNNVNVVVPSTTQQYWVRNSTTGSFTLSISTSGGTPVIIESGVSAILYCNGAQVVRAEVGDIPFTELPDGSAGAPSLAFLNDPTTGLYLAAVGTLGIAAGGTTCLSVTSTAVGISSKALVPNGTAALPTLSFTSDTNTGIYRSAADTLGLSTGGSVRMTISNSSITAFAGFDIAAAFTATGVVNLGGASVVVLPLKTPASAAAAGSTGQFCYDANYFYICLSTGVWRRTAHATW